MDSAQDQAFYGYYFADGVLQFICDTPTWEKMVSAIASLSSEQVMRIKAADAYCYFANSGSRDTYAGCKTPELLFQAQNAKTALQMSLA